MPTRFLIGAGLILGAMVVIALVTYFSNQEAYYTVDELLARSAQAAPADALVANALVAGARVPIPGSRDAGERMQIRGTVDDGSVVRAQEGLEMRFTLTGKHGALPVVYHGLVPDTFDLADEVTVAGQLGADGSFTADQLFVQCPSKYQAAPPGQADRQGSLGSGG